MSIPGWNDVDAHNCSTHDLVGTLAWPISATTRRAGAVSRTIPGALSRAVSIGSQLGGHDVDSRM